ncbi:hypothetical protein AB6A23_24595 [Paenibacillus tarimensis]
MKSKRKILWPVVMLLILGSWAGNIWYYLSMQLAEPLFLHHNITIGGDWGERIELTFLENNNADYKVTGLQIEQLPQLRFEFYESRKHIHHTEMKAYAELRADEVQQHSKEPITINEVTVYYNQGQPKKVPIGEIHVVWNSEEGLVDFISGSSSSSGEGSYVVNLTKQATLEKVDFTFSEKLKPWFELNLSGEPVDSLDYPIELVQGDRLAFTYQWSIPDNEPAALEVYQSKIMLHFLTEDGRTVIEYVPINHNLNLSDHQLKRLVRSGGYF